MMWFWLMSPVQTPVFSGAVRKGMLWIGDEAVLDVPDREDREVWVGIRPEGFIPDEDGLLTCRMDRVEVMGRDVSVVSTHPASQNPVIRSIIDADNKVDLASGTVRYNIKPHKLFLFDKETEERIYFDLP